MDEIHIEPIPINPARDRWGNRRNQEIQTIVAGVNDLSEEVDLLAEGVIPDLTDAGMAAVAESGGEFTAALTAQIGALSATSFGVSAAASGAANTTNLQAAVNAAIAAKVPLRMPSGTVQLSGDEILVNGPVQIVGPGSDALILRKTTKARGIFKVTGAGCSFSGFTVQGEGLDVTGHPLNGADSFRRHVGIWALLTAADLHIDDVKGVDIGAVVSIGDYWPGQSATYSAPALARPVITNIEATGVWCGVVGGPVSDARIDGVTGDWKYYFGTPTNGDPNSPPHLTYISSDTAHPSDGVIVSRVAGSGVSASGGALKLKHMSGARVDAISARDCKGLAEFEEVTDSVISGLSSSGDTYPTTGDNRGSIWLVNCQRIKFLDPAVRFANVDHGLAIWMNSQCADIELVRPRVVANRLTASSTVYGIRGTGPGLIVRDPYFESKGATIQAGIYLEGADSRVSDPVAVGAMVHAVYARTGRQLLWHDSLSLLPSRAVAGSRTIGIHADAVAGGSAFRDRALGQPAAIGFSDTFDRADVQTLGYTDNLKPWRYFGIGGEFNGTWQIIGNAAQYVAGSARCIAVAEGGKADGTLTAVIGSLPVTSADGLVVRAVDVNNYVAVIIDPATGRPILQKRVAGSGTTVFSGGAGTEFVAGDTLGIVTSGTSVSVTRNGTQIIAPQVIADFATATFHGMVGVTGGTPSKFNSIAFA